MKLTFRDSLYSRTLAVICGFSRTLYLTEVNKTPAGIVQAVAYDVLRHRLILRYEAEAEGVTADRVIGELIARIAVP